MNFQVVIELAEHLAAVYKVAVPEVAVEACPAEFTGDFTVNCFLLAKQLRRSPLEIAVAAGSFLKAHPQVQTAEVIKAFVNVSLCPAALFRDTVADMQLLLADARLPAAGCRRILLEYSAPNTNKPQHLGHVRNNTLGIAMTKLLRAAGHEVIPINLINDRGIHICKSMIAYQRWGNGATPDSTGSKGDHFVGDFYVKFDSEFRKQLADLRSSQPELKDKSAEDLFLKTELGRAAQDMLVAWEGNDPAVRRLWEIMNGWVIDGFNVTYERMGVEFSRTYLESQTYELGKDIIEQGLARGVFRRREDGATVIDLDGKGMGTKVVLRSDGTSVYVTQDIGTTLLKQNDFQPDMQAWIVGDEQIFHFQVLFAILRKIGYEWADNLQHIAYGMVNLPTGKMKSREGTVVDADDLMDEMENLAREATLERAGDSPPDDLEQRSRVIAQAALKFMLLKVNPKTTLLFDPAASIKFEGDTGPYVLYACARISSMLRKATAGENQELDWSLLASVEEKALALQCARYGSALQKAAAELDPSVLAAYLLDLAKAFSRFYKVCSVLNVDDPCLSATRLELCRRVRDLLSAGLAALGIETLDSM